MRDPNHQSETRYGGVYEGGPWAAFSVADGSRRVRGLPYQALQRLRFLMSVEFRPARPFVGGLRGQCVCSVEFPDGAQEHVPERYLRAPGRRGV